MTTHLTRANCDELRAMLIANRDSLLARRGGHLAGKTRTEHAREVLLQDGDDATQRDSDREVDLVLSDREVVEMAEISAALLRLDGGSYGNCADCGQAIPLARLRLEPAALRCVSCEDRHERREARPSKL